MSEDKRDDQLDAKGCYCISEETLARAKQCNKDFSCLSDERTDLCRIESSVEGRIHYIVCLNGEKCPYQGTFGKGVVCFCPVRKELYNKYGV